MCVLSRPWPFARNGFCTRTGQADAQDGQQRVDGTGENAIWDVDQQWLCSAGATPYHKDYKECVEFRNQFWTDQFFEISIKGKVQTKSEMIAMQRAAHPSRGVGPHPDDFKLMAVYGNFALATDHTFLQSESKDGKVEGTETRVLRMFARENGKWRPAGGALVSIRSVCSRKRRVCAGCLLGAAPHSSALERHIFMLE